MIFKDYKFKVDNIRQDHLHILVKELLKIKMKASQFKLNVLNDGIQIVTNIRYNHTDNTLTNVNMKIFNNLTIEAVVENKKRTVDTAILYNYLVQWDVIEDPFSFDKFTILKTSYDCSSYEMAVIKILKTHNIFFERELSPKGCISLDKASLFFYFVLFNRTMIIEVDGQYHYPPLVPTKTSTRDYKRRQKQDAIKNKYCKDNNLLLLRLPWFEIEQGNAQTIIFDFIKENKLKSTPTQLSLFRNTNICI
jgi:hypothetical protein